MNKTNALQTRPKQFQSVEKRTHSVSITVSEKEFETLNICAQEPPRKSISQFVRECFTLHPRFKANQAL